MKKTLLLGVLSLVAIFTFWACSTQTPTTTDPEESLSYVTVDINPAVAFILDEDDNVLLINALNEDGDLLLFNLELVGEGLDQAIAMLIEEAGDLGFIDPEVAETIVEIDVIGKDVALENAVRAKVETALNDAFTARELPVQVRARVYDQEFINEAQARGFTAREYRLAQQAFMADPNLTWEEAHDLDVDALIARVREHGANISAMAQSLRIDFLAAKEAVLDEYLPLIEALEADIEDAIQNDEPTETLVADLEALRLEMHDALQAVVTDFVAQALAIREQIENAYQERKEQFENLIPRP